MIELIDVSKRYRIRSEVKTICQNVHFTFHRGRSVGILGRNGAGKSTMMKMLAGTILPDSGRIERHCNVSWPLGFAGSFHAELSGIENTRFVARIYGKDVDELIEFVEEFAELGEAIHMPVKTYSSGMKARLAFGVSMGIHFDVYLVDEITAVGDTNFRKKCEAVFAEKLQNSDVIMISHSPSTLKKFCESGIVLERGKLSFFDNLERALELHEANMEVSA